MEYSRFWQLTLREILKITQARQRFLRSGFENSRAANYELAQLVSFAFHDPKKMPEYKAPGLSKGEPTVADGIAVRAALRAMANRKQSQK